MARSFARASSQYLELGQAPATTTPLTMACWFKPASLGNLQYMIYLADLSETDQAFGLSLDATDEVLAIAYDGTIANAKTTADAVVDVWQHACGVFTSNVLRAAYLDGGNKGTDIVDRSPSGIDRISIARAGDFSPGYHFDGEIAEAAIWNVALTDAEVSILAKGFSPLLVRPQSLIAYWPLIRDEDQDRVGGYDLTPTNSPTVAAHVPILYPHSLLGIGLPTAAAEGPVTYEYTANHASTLWSTDPAKMVDGTEASYASTTTDGDVQRLITNECVGTDLGTITKVEIRAYAYADVDDQLIIRPVFGGASLGDNHVTVPGVTAGWGAWQDVTTDTNAPDWSSWVHVQNLDCEVEQNDVSKGNILYCGMVQIQVTYSAAGETFYKTIEGALALSGIVQAEAKKSLAGVFSSAGIVTKKPTKSLTGSLSFVGTVTKKATRFLAGSLTMAGVLKGKAKKVLAGALSSSGVLQSKAKKVLAGTLSASGTLKNKAKKSLTGSLTSAGAVTKKTTKSLAGALTMAGTIDAIKKIIKVLEGAIAFTGEVTAKAKKVLAGSIAPASTVTKKTTKSLAGTLTMAGAVIGIKKIVKILEGAITFSGDLKTKAKKVLAGTLTSTGAVAKKTTKTLAGTFTSSGIVTAIKKFYKTIEGAITFSGDLAAKAKKVLIGSIAPVGAVTKKPTKALAGALTMAGALAAKARKALAGTLATAGTVTKKPTKTLAGTLAPIGTVVKKTTKTLAGALTMAGDLFAELAGGELFYKTIEGAITFTGTLTKKPKKVLSGTLTMIGTLAARIRGTAGLQIRAALGEAWARAASKFTGEIRAGEVEPPDIKGAKKL